MNNNFYISVNEDISVFVEEYGQGENYILSAQVGFYKKGMQQKMAELGYHVLCITLRGFSPSTLVTQDYGENWYDIFADDVIAVADKLGIQKFIYMGASHGCGVGWHVMLKYQNRINAFIAVVGGPHSLDSGVMSYRQMLEKGIIKEVPPFNPPIDNDEKREIRRKIRADHIASQPPRPALEKAVDYGRPLMKYKNEENLCKALSTITVPTLMIGGINDPISTPELMIRTAKCLPHCKLVIYSNCGHDIDTDLIEETCDVADRFIKTTLENGKWYKSVEE